MKKLFEKINSEYMKRMKKLYVMPVHINDLKHEQALRDIAVYETVKEIINHGSWQYVEKLWKELKANKMFVK